MKFIIVIGKETSPDKEADLDQEPLAKAISSVAKAMGHKLRIFITGPKGTREFAPQDHDKQDQKFEATPDVTERTFSQLDKADHIRLILLDADTASSKSIKAVSGLLVWRQYFELQLKNGRTQKAFINLADFCRVFSDKSKKQLFWSCFVKPKEYKAETLLTENWNSIMGKLQHDAQLEAGG